MNDVVIGAGSVLGGFKLVALVGKGGMGEVWRAQNARVERMIRAVKIIRADLARDPDFRARFLNEAEFLEILQHPNILRVENIAEDAGALFMVMELLTGRTVDEVVRAHPQGLPANVAAEILSQALAGVSHAHKNGIIHRDLKPPNLFLTDQHVVKILDFGIARHGDGSGVTKTGQGIPGSPAYYAPEFVDGHPATPASDVYALGITFFELLGGRLPFLPGGSTDAQRMLSLMTQHATKPLPDLRAIRTDVPDAMIELMVQATAKDPTARPTPDDLAVSLRAFVTDEGRAKISAGLAAARTTGPIPMLTQPHQAGTPTAQSAPLPTSFAVPQRGAPSGPHPSAGGELHTRLPLRARGDFGAPSALTPSTPPPQRPGEPGTWSGALGQAGTDGAPPARKSKAPLIAAASVVVVAIAGAAVLFLRPAPLPPVVEPAVVEAPVDPLDALRAKVPDGMVFVAGGEAKVGRATYTEGPAADVPEHTVTLQPYAIGKREVTVAEFKKFADAGHAKLSLPPALVEKLASMPVVNIAWDDAEKYCAWAHPDGGRLPTEHEWERAAGGEQHTLYPWGSSPRPECVNGLQGDDGVLVATEAIPCGATKDGLLHMSGNAWEWTRDEPAPYPGTTLPPLPKGFHVVRGGSFFNTTNDELTTTVRQFVRAPNRFTGFRCAVGFTPAVDP